MMRSAAINVRCPGALPENHFVWEIKQFRFRSDDESGCCRLPATFQKKQCSRVIITRSRSGVINLATI